MEIPFLSAKFIAFKSASEDSPEEEQDKPIIRQDFLLIPRDFISTQFSSQTEKFVSAIIELTSIPLPGADTFLLVNLEVSIAA